MRPKVSVVMPTFNQAGFLAGALEALERQRFPDFELIVVDDGSTDGTQEVLSSWLEKTELMHPVVALRQPTNSGTAQAINAGIAFARGRWWTWISSDNRQYPAWLERLVGLADSDAKIGAAFSAYDRKEGDQITAMRLEAPYEVGDLVRTVNCFFGPSFIIHSKVWRAAGPHQGRISHDYDHWLRVEEVCMACGLKIAYVDEPLCLYDAHDGRATVVRRHEFDAPEWQAAALKRRKAGIVTCMRPPEDVRR